MSESDPSTITIEVELSDSSDSDEGPFRSAVVVRISSMDNQACELMKEVAGHRGGVGGDEISDDEISDERKH